jgi:tetratricopeptide (TPR) repeat protein
MPNGARSNRERAAAVSVFVRLSLCVSVFLAVRPGFAQGAPEKLGTISFPNSGNAAAQEPFLRGMKLYWSFEYARAAEAFKEAQKADPSMALAFVGEALTHTHQVWNQQNVAAAREALSRFAPTSTQRMAKAGSPRERLYVEMAEYLYGDGPKARRDTLFTDAAERIARAHPSDDEAKMFHAIGLLGLNQSVRDFTTYMKAGALAEEVLRRNPDHPAAAHFVIHAFDDPIHAPLGLWAARLYSKIAPGAPHAQHMTSHIFVALGMWDDVISQNVIASGHDHDNWQAGHYTIWLGYGLLQAGRIEDARKHIESLARNSQKAQRAPVYAGLAALTSHFYVDAGAMIGDASWLKIVPAQLTLPFANVKFVNGLEALRTSNPARAQALASELEQGVATGSPDGRAAFGVLAKELRAAIASAAGKHDEAISLARAASESEEGMPYEFGPPQFVKPTHELLGEVLLKAGKPAEAQAAFARSLSRMPGRARSLIGLARAAHAAGDKSTAETAVAQLKASWHAADKNLTELTELTKLLAAGAK